MRRSRHLTLGGLNVDQPYMGPNDKHVDMWVGYSIKLKEKRTWRIQLNVRGCWREGSFDSFRYQS